ncbi:MAG: hypothetical protein RSA29_17110 [Clostridium sp.]|uniref:hypothetical protein n=1 Tax=Clostridium sp. TaxID=1506 RepID=UPI003063373C
MNDMHNLKYYLNMLNGSRRYELERLILDEAKIYGLDIEKDICYLQNLFVEDKNPVLYVFTTKKVIIFSVDNTDDGNVTVKLCEKLYLKNISYTHSCYDSEYQVKFSMNGEEITLVANNDTNQAHADNFNSNIKNIIEYLKSI